ncbi:MAG: ferritin [Chloroflexota bacterium]
MLSAKMQTAFNEQIQKELYSAYLYLAMSNHFDNKNLPGFAKWLLLQFQEEQEHAFKFIRHVQDRGGKVVLEAIQKPQGEWDSNLAAFKQVLEHEQYVTASINSLYETALAEKDYPAQILLQWFIDEQVEEEKNASDVIAQLELIEERGTAMLMLDHQLAKRGG